MNPHRIGPACCFGPVDQSVLIENTITKRCWTTAVFVAQICICRIQPFSGVFWKTMTKPDDIKIAQMHYTRGKKRYGDGHSFWNMCHGRRQLRAQSRQRCIFPEQSRSKHLNHLWYTSTSIVNPPLTLPLPCV